MTADSTTNILTLSSKDPLNIGVYKVTLTVSLRDYPDVASITTESFKVVIKCEVYEVKFCNGIYENCCEDSTNSTNCPAVLPLTPWNGIYKILDPDLVFENFKFKTVPKCSNLIYSIDNPNPRFTPIINQSLNQVKINS